MIKKIGNIKVVSSIIVLLMIIVSLGAVVSMVEKVESSETFDYVSGELIVCFKDFVDLKEGDKDPALGFKIIETIPSLSCAVVEIPKNKEDYYIKIYEKDDNVVYAEKNGIVQKLEFPNDPHWEKQYGPRNIKCPEAWSFMSWNMDPVIAIVDTGIECKNGNIHEDLAPNYIGGYDFVDDDEQPWDGDSHRHGTHCAGIAAAATHNSIGIAGVTGANSPKIVAVRVLGADGGTFDDVAQGILYAALEGPDHKPETGDEANVISMSLGCYYDSSTVKSACKKAWEEGGSVLVAAAGNDNKNANGHYPSAYQWVISVAAIDSNNKKASFSNYGKDSVELCAPGERIYSCSENNGYRYLSGTSMACPHVSGVAALAFARDDTDDTNENGRINDEIRDKLFSSADAIEGTGNYWKYGRVDATLGGAPPVETPSITVTIDSVTNEGSGLDDIDVWPWQAPEWSYETKIITESGTQKVKNHRFKEITYSASNAEQTDGENLSAKFWTEEFFDNDHDDGSDDPKAWYFGDSYIFPVENDHESTAEVRIKLMDEDYADFVQDIADICARPNDDGDSPLSDQKEGGRVFILEYDFTQHKIIDENSDMYKIDGNGLKYTRGDWDGSTDEIVEYKHDDALLRFDITDDYVEPDSSFSVSGDKITNHPVSFSGNSEVGFEPLTYSWDFGDQHTANGKNTNHAYSSAGSYTVKLTVSDRFGVSKTSEQTINIVPNQNPGKPSSLSGETRGKVGTSYTYTCSSVTDPDGDTVTYVWNFGGDNEETSSPSNSHTWSEKGSYTVKVKARDSYGGESGWTELSVRMPKTKSASDSLISELISRFPKILEFLFSLEFRSLFLN